MPFQVINSPFNDHQAELLNKLVDTLTEEQRIWLSGYLASPLATVVQQTGTPQSSEKQATAAAETRTVTVLYGSHTGNCQRLAEELSVRLKANQSSVQLYSLDEFKPKSLKNVEDLLILTSTHGDGDPPDNALTFYEYLFSKRAPKLGDVRYSVLSLGDSSYEFFCQTGKDFDQRLEELGAERLYERVDCDLDFEESAEEWADGVLAKVGEGRVFDNVVDPAPAQTEVPVHSKSNPFQAEVIENINLNGRGSKKETRHVELDLEGSGLDYEPGDSLGIYPENDPELVEAILQEMGWNPDETVPINKDGEIRSLQKALLESYDITTLSKPLLEKALELTTNPALQELLETGWREYVEGRDLLDLIQDFSPWTGTAQEFVGILRKMPPRLYSIASSLKANPDEVHLTIGTVRYRSHDRDRTGVCSGQCAERTEPGQTIPVYVQKNQNFRLPPDDTTSIIMVGAGTGVAPYRSFLEEREEREAEGKSWLFFGDQHFVTDFLYQTEWQRWLKDEVLTKLSLAFSRDTEEKVYVQHKMQENAAEIYRWIVEGAHFYVCGDEKYMAKDVEQTLLAIIEQEGNLTAEEAKDYLAEMRRNRRYQRDVY